MFADVQLTVILIKRSKYLSYKIKIKVKTGTLTTPSCRFETYCSS